MTENIVSRAELLIQQQKFVEAEKLLKDVLSSDPNDVYVLTLLAEVNLQLKKIEGATALINSAIAINPEAAHLFYVKARIAIEKNEYDDAEKNIAQSLKLDPRDANYYALWASMKLARKQYDRALELANKTLELDSANLLGLNIRSTALLKLNKSTESFQTIEGALREDPNNAYTHANYGWNLLEKGEHRKALEHFREALKIDPNFEYAQAGMLEALKASNVFYRLFLKYSFWIGNLTAKYQWAVIIGFYFGFRMLRSLASSNETLRPYLTPLIILLGIIAFSTWIITPIGNLFLRLNKYGQHLLSKKELMSSNFVGISFLVFVIGVVCYFILIDDKFLTLAAFGFSMMLPYGAMFAKTKYKHALIIYAGIMTVLGIAAVTNTFSTGQVFNGLTPVFIIGFVIFQWVANFIIIKESNV